MTLTPEEIDELLKPDYYIAYPVSTFEKHFILKRVAECLRPPEPMEIANDVAQARKERDKLKQALEKIKGHSCWDGNCGRMDEIAEKALASITVEE